MSLIGMLTGVAIIVDHGWGSIIAFLTQQFWNGTWYWASMQPVVRKHSCLQASNVEIPELDKMSYPWKFVSNIGVYVLTAALFCYERIKVKR